MELSSGLKKGDPCPTCEGTLKAVREPTEEQRALAADKDNPSPLPPHVDTASKRQRAELGALYRCENCGYQARFPTAV